MIDYHGAQNGDANDDSTVDPIESCDQRREGCPVTRDERLGWLLSRNDDIRGVLKDPDTFSNAVSRHLSVPNGMDPPDHTPFRRLVEPYFESTSIARLAPELRRVASDLADAARGDAAVEFVTAFCEPFAARAQCRFLGWPPAMAGRIAAWTRRNQIATRAQDRDALAQISIEFETLVIELLDERRAAGNEAPDDNTTRLLTDRVQGRALTDDEIVSILRSWTMGEVATLAAALGIIAAFLADNPDEQARLRREPNAVPDAVEEILRLRGPLASNRRRATRDTEIDGRRISAGERITLLWVAANRDPETFDDALAYRPGRDQSRNLLWGEGLHVCPGAPLARLEMRVAVEALLATATLTPQTAAPRGFAAYPASGYESLPLRLE